MVVGRERGPQKPRGPPFLSSDPVWRVWQKGTYRTPFILSGNPQKPQGVNREKIFREEERAQSNSLVVPAARGNKEKRRSVEEKPGKISLFPKTLALTETRTFRNPREERGSRTEGGPLMVPIPQ